MEREWDVATMCSRPPGRLQNRGDCDEGVEGKQKLARPDA